VDIHGLVHRGGRFAVYQGVFGCLQAGSRKWYGLGWRHRRSRKIFGEPAVFEAKQVQVSKPDRQPGGSLIEVEEFF
jgi:hypothetical protein